MLSLPLMERSLAAAAQIGVIFISAAPEPEPGRGERGGWGEAAVESVRWPRLHWSGTM